MSTRFPPSALRTCLGTLILGALLLGALLSSGPAPSAWARGGAAGSPAPEPPAAESPAAVARVPSVSGLHVAEAQRRLERAGFRVGRIEEYAPARTLALFQVRGVIGFVFSQRPKPGVMHRTDRPVDLRMTAVRDGVRLPVPPRAPVPPPDAPPRAEPSDGSPAPAAGALPPVDPSAEVIRPHIPAGMSPVTGPANPGAGLAPPPAYAEGSPEAPRAAPMGNRDVVPTLLGLSLSDAEQLCTEAGMRLHVDRVAGHPIGRVLEQSPSAGGRRPAGGVVSVVVTAGGDFESDQAPIAPSVYLAKIAVPGLLDRTRLQAIRIIEDLGLRVQEEQARRGLADRVVDQMPPAGGRVPRGGVVRIWIGPPDPAAAPPSPPGPTPGPTPAPAPEGPADPAPAPDKPTPGAPPEPEVPAPKPPLPPGPLSAGVPDPLSPGHGTVLPKEASLPIGFTWRGVKGAEAYILEIEEEAAEGRWMANARKPSRKTAVILDVERLNSRSSGRLRWRVTAVSNGRQGTPSKWVILK